MKKENLFRKQGKKVRHVFLLLLVLTLWIGGCSGKKTEIEKDPFKAGTLKALGHLAPKGSSVQFLALVAEQLGWEDEVSKNPLIKIAAEEKDFEQKIEPFLLSLFFKHGFSVLPMVGEGHQFSRDTVVRGAVKSSRFLVPTREKVRLIFLTEVENIQIIYPQDGVQPQVFTVNPDAVMTLRRSLIEQYLR